MANTESRPERPHGVTLEERARLRVTGVVDVERFDEEEILVATVKGRLAVRGRELRVESLRTESGELMVCGVVDGFEYLGDDLRPGGVWARLFG